ncbi:hypothetical protein [Escherichia coli]|uniref:hypothetical protein n=1 Tax=Escherichia coli TaxID=562 RepID=UPI0018D44A12|nr:hypothetical protein [Escherichia coli]
MDLDFGNGRTGKLHIESFTAREFSLLGKLESADDLQGMALEEVVEARIEVQNPSFLQQVLLERFQELRLGETFAMKAGLTSLKSAMVLKSGVNRSSNHISSTFRWASFSSLRED